MGDNKIIFGTEGIMKTCGILIAKEKSKRFPGKNRLLWRDNADILIDCIGCDNVFMFTDDPEIIAKCRGLGIKVILKNINFDDEMSYLEAIRYTYLSLGVKYEAIVSILCDSVGNNIWNVADGLEKLSSDHHADEVRSFDENGNQSGIFIFRADRLPEKWHHMAAITSNGKEIHYREELDERTKMD